MKPILRALNAVTLRHPSQVPADAPEPADATVD